MSNMGMTNAKSSQNHLTLKTGH